jgi:hypothetical protein
MHILKRQLACILFLLLFSAEAFSQVFNRGSLTVNVYDAKNRKPLKGVYSHLSINDKEFSQTKYTNDNGSCNYNNLPNRKFRFYCSGPLDYRSISVDNFMIDNDSLVFNLYLKKRRKEFFFQQFIGRINFHQGWRGMGEISLGIANYDEDHQRRMPDMNHLQSIEMGCQFNFNKDHFIIGPSLTYNRTHVIFHYGVSLIYYTDFDKRTLFINPHLGFSWNTYFDFYFGYNIPLMKNEMKGMVNRFTFTISIPLFNRLRIGDYSKNYRYDPKKKKLVKGG